MSSTIRSSNSFILIIIIVIVKNNKITVGGSCNYGQIVKNLF